MQNELQALRFKIRSLERRVTCLTIGCVVLIACVAIVIKRDTVHADLSPQSLTVKRLAVIDEKGVERVVISAPLPDPLEHGKRYKREGAISGILIFDPKGNERGAYVTTDTEALGAFLTLDSEDGQVFTAYANAKGTDGATMSLNSDKRDEVTLTTYEQPRIQIVQNRKVVQKIPTTAPDLR